jgi:hypothetical protein
MNFIKGTERLMSDEEMNLKFEGISLRTEMNLKIPKVTAVRLMISIAMNFQGKDQVNTNTSI